MSVGSEEKGFPQNCTFPHHLHFEDGDGDKKEENTFSKMEFKSSASPRPRKVLNRNELKESGKQLTLLKRLTSSQCFTRKSYFKWTTNARSPFSVGEMISVSSGNLEWFRVLCLLSILLFISSSLPNADAVLLEQSKCETFGWNAYPVWKYRAKPRYVAPQRTDRRMQQEFLELFRGNSYYGKDSSSSEEDYDVPLDIAELQRISDMCAPDAFFYSLSPKHLEASASLARMFVSQPSPPDVLRLAKALHNNRYINPKVWYYGIMGAGQERTDMTGFHLAHPIDTMPDLFIPAPLLLQVRDKYRSALQERLGVFSNSTDTYKAKAKTLKGNKKREKRSPSEPPTPRNTIKRLVRKLTSGNGTRIALTSAKRIELGQQARGEGVKVSSSAINSTRTARRYKIEIGSSKGIYKVNKTKRPTKSSGGSGNSTTTTKKNTQPKVSGSKNPTKNNAKPKVSFISSNPMKKNPTRKPKPEVKNRRNTTNHEEKEKLLAESSRSPSWMKARTDSDAYDDCIIVDGTVGLDNGIENKLWYFREDMMVNQHHWYWHQEYPLNATRHRPRRGELFFYMHRNLVARYNAERLSNMMPPLEPFDIRPGAEIRTAYDSHLADIKSGRFWTPRPHGIHLSDIIHELDKDFERNIFVGQYNELYWRLIRSIKVGHLLLNPLKTLNIRHTKGIEPLGNTVEASELSVNPIFYDAMGFHNLGHQVIGLSVDPKYQLKIPTGVMADTATTMRDPEFYSYHTVVDGVFEKYKRLLKPYQPRGGEYPLRWDGVEILDIEVISKNGGSTKNELRTFWSTKRFELSPGVDQSIHKGDLDVDVCAVHLNHEPFDFKITVTLDPCAKTKSNKGTVRIFLAPRFDSHGHRLSLSDQRRLMIHMDAFPVDLRVGRNVLFRRSFDSNAVTPWTKHIKEYEEAPKYPNSAEFCGCGWPTHLYIPKGSPDGMPFDLFVMITNYDHDYVEDDPEDLSIPEPCNSPYLYCGVKFRRYPDAKPMGYPFDRLPFNVPFTCGIPEGVASIWTLVICKIMQFLFLRPVATLEEYVSYAPNMGSTVVEIKHLDHLAW